MVRLLLKKYLSRKDIDAIASAIAAVEETTSGEVRVAIRRRRWWSERKLSLHELALGEFRRLGMHATKDKTGVLLLFVMSERKFHIIADEGIDRKVDEGMWNRLAGELSGKLKAGPLVDGILHAVDAVGKELQTHFPRKPGDTNELPNDVVEE